MITKDLVPQGVQKPSRSWQRGAGVPARTTGSSPSSIAFPGNDFWLFDDRLVVFHHYAGNGASTGFTTSADRGDIGLCTSAFEAVWELAIPHRNYRPA